VIAIGSYAAGRDGEGLSLAGRQWTSWIVLAGAAAVFLVGLGSPVYETRDVSRYAQMVLEMRHAHTLVPTFEGLPYYEAAPLAAWAPYASAWLFGSLSPFSVRLPAALAALATCALALVLGSRFSPRAGRIAGAAACLNVLALSYGRGSRIEEIHGLAVTGAVIAFFAGTRTGSRGRALLLYALAGACAALGIAAKGPAAAALIGIALLPVLLYERRWHALVVGGAVAAAVAVALTAAWLLPYVDYLGPAARDAFFRQFLLMETVAKIENGFGKAEPFWTYVVEMLPKLAPWSLLAAVALWRILRRPRSASAVERLCASWLVFPVLLLSMASGKHIRYVVPVVPALAVLAGIQADRWLDAPQLRSLRSVDLGLGVLGGLLAAAGVLAPIALTLLFDPDPYATACAFGTGGVALLAGLATLRLAPRGRYGPAFLSLYLATVAVVVFANAAVLPLPAVAERQNYVRLAEALEPYVRSSDAPLWIVPSENPIPSLSPAHLALHLGNRWIAPLPPGPLPGQGLILSPKELPGCSVRARFPWQAGRYDPQETWYLLDRAGSASGAA